MYLESNTTAGLTENHWLRTIDISYDSKKCNYEFLYIGADIQTSQLLFNSFERGMKAESFNEAQQMINDLVVADKHLPDVIFIDLPFDKVELVQLCLLLQNKNILYKTVLLCIEKQLCYDKSAFLQYFEHIDDVVDITAGEINYTNKISFLRRCKMQYNAFGISKQTVAKKRSFKSGLKRFLDIILAAAIILLLLPLFLLIALAIKIESKGPVIYTSYRAGRGFKVFRFFKFRTMEVNADKKMEALIERNQYRINESGPKFFKITNDPRITRVGRFLRNSSLDELPQLFNVLKGDMSLVGNRPLPIYEASTLTTNEFVERFMAPAGMTGLWQVKKRGKPNMSTEERINLDISYARKSNMLFDFWIMANTPKALFQKSNV